MARIRFSALPASRRAWLSHLFALGLGLVLTLSGQFAHAALEEPDAFIKRQKVTQPSASASGQC